MCIVGANASEGLHRWSKEAANVDAATALATFIFVIVRGLVQSIWTVVGVGGWGLQNNDLCFDERQDWSITSQHHGCDVA